MNILVPLVDGFEEIEALATVNILRRAGINVVTAGLPGTMVTGSNNIKVVADKMLRDIKHEDFQGIVLPGGKGCPALVKSTKVMQILRDFDSKKKLIAAICYTPALLSKEGFLDGKRATVYPGRERELSKPRDAKVVVDDHYITSQGPGTAIEFALKIVEVTKGKETAERLRKGIVA